MKKQQYRKIALFVSVAALAASMQVSVADMASASGVLSSVAVIATQANANLAVAANAGDNMGAIADAQKRVAAVDSAMAEAQEAYATLESGNEAGAADLEVARQKAEDALKVEALGRSQKIHPAGLFALSM